VVTAGFFAYYVIYLFLPVAGPQFYFGVIDPSLVPHGPFPAIGAYFNLHPDAPIVGNDVPGLFQWFVELAHEGGERPVAAFPSSHVGMATVIMILFLRLKPAVFYVMLPLYILLCGATVYIGAHYLVDIFGGWATGFLFFILFDRLYLRLSPDN
jgi:membrane-associated phospholipid phosphatase